MKNIVRETQTRVLNNNCLKIMHLTVIKTCAKNVIKWIIKKGGGGVEIGIWLPTHWVLPRVSSLCCTTETNPHSRFHLIQAPLLSVQAAFH